MVGDKAKIKLLEKELKKKNKIIIVALIATLLSTVTILFILYNVGLRLTLEYDNKSEYVNYSEMVEVVYENLTEEEIEKVHNVMSQIKLDYLAQSDKIIFTNDIKQHCDDCYGINKRSGMEIAISYSDDTLWLKQLICHEILHSMMINDNGDLPTHQVIRDIASRRICFK